MLKTLCKSFFLLVLCLFFAACSGSPSKETVAASIKKIMPANFEVVSVAPLKELPGLIEVLVKMDKQPVVFYMDNKNQYLLSGTLIHVESKKNLTLEAQGRIK